MSTRPVRSWPLSTSCSSTTSGFHAARVRASRSSCTLPSAPWADSMLKETTVRSVRLPGTQVSPVAVGSGSGPGARSDVGAEETETDGVGSLGVLIRAQAPPGPPSSA